MEVIFLHLFVFQAHLKRWVDVVMTTSQAKPQRKGEVGSL